MRLPVRDSVSAGPEVEHGMGLATGQWEHNKSHTFSLVEHNDGRLSDALAANATPLSLRRTIVPLSFHSPPPILPLIPRMRRTRRIDPRSFDLSAPCPLCGYRIPPGEIMGTSWSLIHCPSCGQGFDSMPEKKPPSAT